MATFSLERCCMEQKKIKINKSYFLFFWQAVRLFMARHLKKKKKKDSFWFCSKVPDFFVRECAW